jgi:hypothetical protein
LTPVATRPGSVEEEATCTPFAFSLVSRALARRHWPAYDVVMVMVMLVVIVMVMVMVR